MNGTQSSCCSDLPTDETMDKNCNSIDVACDICDTLAASKCCVPNVDELLRSELTPETSANVLGVRDCSRLNMKHDQLECDVTTQDCEGSHHSDCNTKNAVEDMNHCETNRSEGEEEEETQVSSVSLRSELAHVKAQLLQKEEQCEKLTKLHDQTGLELQDLTASLFEEANNMVQEANIKRMATEKKLDEATAKIEILLAEVTALKALVITSTPSAPNPHLNPQIDRAQKSGFTKGHRRSTSHHNFVKEFPCVSNGSAATAKQSPLFHNSDGKIEPLYMELFQQWKREPCLKPASPFLACIVTEDILPCLHFANESLSKVVFDGVFDNSLTVEPLLSSSSHSNRCALTEMIRPCNYCIKLDGSETPFAISQSARNRIIAVCDLLTYLRYISQGLVKCDDDGMYFEIARLRKNMCLARLGLNS